MYVKDRMNKNAVFVQENTSLPKALLMMKDSRHRRLPVVDQQNRPVGVIDQRSIENVGTVSFLISNTKVRDIMQTSFFEINENVVIEECALVIKENKEGFLPVVNNDGVLCGVITSYDVLKGLMTLMDIRGEGCRAIIKSKDTSKITKIIGEAEIKSLYTDDETTVVKFYTKDPDSVRYALTEEFEVIYFKEL